MCHILISFGEPLFSYHGPIFKHVLMANSVVKISVNIIFVVVVNPMSFLQSRLLHEPVIILILIKLDNCLPSLWKSLKSVFSHFWIDSHEYCHFLLFFYNFFEMKKKQIWTRSSEGV